MRGARLSRGLAPLPGGPSPRAVNSGVRQCALGVLLFSTPSADPNMKTVHSSLSALGYLEGRDFSFSYRYADGHPERLADLAAALVQEGPDLILALGGDVAPFAAKATSTIPIVFLSSADPVLLGLVASLARPATNATGVTLLLDDTACKRLRSF